MRLYKYPCLPQPPPLFLSPHYDLPLYHLLARRTLLTTLYLSRVAVAATAAPLRALEFDTSPPPLFTTTVVHPPSPLSHTPMLTLSSTQSTHPYPTLTSLQNIQHTLPISNTRMQHPRHPRRVATRDRVQINSNSACRNHDSGWMLLKDIVLSASSARIFLRKFPRVASSTRRQHHNAYVHQILFDFWRSGKLGLMAAPNFDSILSAPRYFKLDFQPPYNT
ncbi:hypothetical protein C8R43DRAFT_1131554 [Mycena crocata]|nr:hypothetical protein C8R43DRAFT_1131554 [Mycena crocata]